MRKGHYPENDKLHYFSWVFISLFIRKQSLSFQSNLFILEQQSCAVIHKLKHPEFSPVGNMNDVPFKMI